MTVFILDMGAAKVTKGPKQYAKYKDSGVNSPRRIPAHWEVRYLGQIGTLSKGNGGNKQDNVEQGVPCVRYGDLYTAHNYFISESRSFISPGRLKDYTPIKYGDVLFAASGETMDEIGKSAVNLMRSEAYCGGDIILFRPQREVDARFMGYVTDCRPAIAQKATMGRGFTVVHIYGKQLKYLTIPLPPLPEQQAIGHFLDHKTSEIDALIAAKERLITLLQEKRAALITTAVTKGLDPSAPMKDSGIEWLGQFPAHWEVLRLGQIGDLSKGNGGSKQDEVGHGVPCIRYGDLYTTHNHFIHESRSFVSPERSKGYTSIEYGDVLFAASGETMDEIGKSAVNLMRSEACCGGDIILFRAQREVDPLYMGHATDCHYTIAQKVKMGRGFTVVHIYGSQLKNLMIPLPPIQEQQDIGRFLEKKTSEFDKLIVRIHKGIERLREYRTALISAAVTGKIDVRDTT